MNVMFLSISAGGGHIKAAEAVKEGIEQKFPNSKTMVVDTLKYISPMVDKIVVGSYLSTVRTTPNFYKKLYKFSESSDNMYGFSKAVTMMLSYKLLHLIKSFEPSIIVCTHPFPLQMLSNLRKKDKICVPTVAILTDYVTHPFWFHECTDAYVVAHDYMKSEMISRGIPEDIIYPLGIPVSKNFLQIKDRISVLNDLGLDNKTTVLIMGGSLGIGEIQSSFTALLKCKKDIQIIVITGKNQKMKEQLEKYSLSSDKKVKILSYTDKVADFMHISDILITKPGGMTISEALVKELPIFIISPIPGQEEGNAHFLTNNGAAARILNDGDMEEILSHIIDSPVKMKNMKAMAKYLAKPNSSNDIVTLLQRLAN